MQLPTAENEANEKVFSGAGISPKGGFSSQIKDWRVLRQTVSCAAKEAFVSFVFFCSIA